MKSRLFSPSDFLSLFGLIALVSCSWMNVYAACSLPVPSVSTSGPLTFCSGQSVTLTASSGANYDYQWKKNGSNISGATNISYVATTSGNYTVVVTVDTCSSASLPSSVTVNPLPNATLTADHSICQGVSTTLIAGGGTSYNWSAPGANANLLVVSPGNTTNYSVTVTNSYGCNAVKTVQVTVKPLPLANISVAGSSTLCNGQSVNLNSSTGTGYAYQWSLNSLPIQGATSSTLNVNAPGNYQVTTTLNGCSRESAATNIVVNPLPVPEVSDDTTICSGTSATLHASGGTSYQWNSGGPAAADFIVSPNATKTYTVTVTNSYGCTAAASTTVSVIPLPNANITLSGSLTLCSGESVTLNASTGSGYTHQWFRNNTQMNGSVNPSLTVSTQGAYHVVVRQNGCSKTSATQNVAVNPLPVPQVSNDTTICAGVTVNLQASGGTAYQWSSGGPASATYQVAPASTKTYTVTVTNSYGCTQSASVTITVLPLPQTWVSAAGSTTLCTGQTVNLNTANGTGYIYQWYRNGSAIANSNSNTYTASLAGVYHVVNMLDGCKDTSGTVSVTVNPLPVTTVSNDTTICSGDTVTLTASGGTSYSWNTGFVGQNYTVSTTSTRTYVVNISDVNTCTVARSVTVTTIPLPNASVSLSGPSVFCADRTLTMTASSGTGYAYEWRKDNIGISGAASNVYVASQSGSYMVKVTANGCFKNSAPVSVTVNPLPVAFASNDTTICSADTVQLYVAGGATYQWFNGSTNSTIQVAPTNTTTYGVTVSNSFGCTASESVTISTIARPAATVTPGGSVGICSGQTTTLSASTGTGYSYQWKQGANTLNGATNSTYTTGVPGSYHVVVTANGCPKKSNATTITVNPLPVVSTSNDTTICSGNPVMLTAGGGSTYKWSTGSTNQTITVTPAASTTYNVTVTSAQNCSATGDVFISVIPTPNANISLSAPAAICQGDTVTLTASTGSTYAYQWKKDGSDITGETSASYQATTAGSYSVFVSAFGCPKTSSAVVVSVNPLPTATASNDTTVCQGTTVDLTAFGGTSYHWSNGRFSQTNSVTPSANSSYSVTVTDANGCTATEDVAVSVLPLPNANISTSGSSNLCSGQSVMLTASSGAGYSYQWRKNGNPVPGAVNSSFAAGETGSFSAIVTLNGCSKTSNAVQVNVNPSLQATASNDTTICSGDTLSLFAAGGATYAWSTGDTSSAIFVAPAGNKTYSVTVSNGTTCTDVEMVNVTVKPRPNAFINVSGGATSICQGQLATLNANTGAGLSYQWYRDSVAIASADSFRYLAGDSGSYVVEVTLNGCSKLSVSREITVNPLPVVTLSNDTTVCSESPVTLYVSGGVSYVWNTFATDSVYKITTATTKTYSVTVTNAFGCKATDGVTITTLPLPTNVTISTGSATTICDGQTVRLNVGNTNGTVFQWLLDGTAIPDADSTFYDADTSGDYTIQVTGNGCSKVSPPQHVTVKPVPATPDIIKFADDSLMCSVSGDNYKWFRDGVTFSVGKQKVKISKSGAYTVYVSQANCPSDTSAPYYFFFTGIATEYNKGLLVYPNPSKGRFTLALPMNTMDENTRVQVYNTLGEKVWEAQRMEPNRQEMRIDLSELPQGIYYLRAGASEEKITIIGH